MHFFPIVIVEAASLEDARDEAASWVAGLFEDKNADGADYGEVAEGALSEVVARAGTDKFRTWIRQAAIAERELAREHWQHAKKMALAFADRKDPPEFGEKYEADGFKQTAFMGYWHAMKLYGLQCHRQNHEAFSTLGRLYDRRSDKSVHPLELPASANAYAVLCDFHA